MHEVYPPGGNSDGLLVGTRFAKRSVGTDHQVWTGF
jgi:hypothetical protein